MWLPAIQSQAQGGEELLGADVWLPAIQSQAQGGGERGEEACLMDSFIQNHLLNITKSLKDTVSKDESIVAIVPHGTILSDLYGNLVEVGRSARTLVTRPYGFCLILVKSPFDGKSDEGRRWWRIVRGRSVPDF